MNEEIALIPPPKSLVEKEEESEEEYQIITEDYHSSPKCGIKSQIVKKPVNTITFSPVEISKNPYFKYCVFAIKEEQKNDNSQTETNHTKIKEEKNNTDNLTQNQDNSNISNNIKILKKEQKDDTEECENCENKGQKEKEKEETNFVKIVEEKSNEFALNLAMQCNEINKKIKKKNIKLRKTKDYYYHSLKGKDNDIIKMKLNSITKEEQSKNKKKNAQKNIYNILNNIIIKGPINSNKMNNIKIFQPDENSDNDAHKRKSIFKNNPLAIKKDKSNKENKQIIKMTTSLTSISIKRLKKQKKTQESIELKKLKANILRQHSFIPLNKDKKVKMQIEEKDKDLKKRRRHSLIPPNESNTDNNKIFINMFANNQSKSKSKKTKNRQKKLKSLGEKTYDLLKGEKIQKKLESEKSGTPKKKNNLKNQMEENFKDLDHNNEVPKTSKGKRKVSIFEAINEGRRKKLLSAEEKKEILFKKKSIFCSLKDKDKKKDKNNNKEKEKEKKTRNKKTKRKHKEKKIKNQSSNQIPIKKPYRRDKSFTIISHTNKNFINNDELNINQALNNNSINSSQSKKNGNENNGGNLKENCPELNNSQNKPNRGDIRQNSTRNVTRDVNLKEKITALTNKQTINNINEYTRQCLEIIPDLFDLGDKMPRCKTHINLNFSKNKKIALFDLDETIVHCIGEINIKNLDSLSRQSDAKLKVCLPGGKKEVTIGINIRPHWEEALKKIKDKYHIVAFTASHESYADSVLNYLDPEKKYFEYRLYRAHCVLCVIDDMKFYVKDLKILEDNYDLKDVVIIDNSVLSFAYHLDNGIPISPFYDSKVDSELLDIADFLIKYADEDDIRDKLKEVYKLNQYLEILKNYSSEEIENEEESSDISVVEGEENSGGNTTKNISMNKNRTNINLCQPLIANNKNIDLSKEKEIKVNSKKDNSCNNKNSSNIDLKLRDIFNLFDGNESNEKDNQVHTPKLNDHKIKKYINKNIEEKNYYRSKKREKHKTIIFDFNFKREWDKKQKELKNK